MMLNLANSLRFVEFASPEVDDEVATLMGAGWNYSWYRNGDGKVVTLFGLPVPWSHNWIVFHE